MITRNHINTAQWIVKSSFGHVSIGMHHSVSISLEGDLPSKFKWTNNSHSKWFERAAATQMAKPPANGIVDCFCDARWISLCSPNYWIIEILLNSNVQSFDKNVAFMWFFRGKKKFIQKNFNKFNWQPNKIERNWTKKSTINFTLN